MNKIVVLISSILLMMLWMPAAFGQDEITVVAPTTEAGEDLDLYAIAELFKESESVEEFEKAINDPENEVNNLDLNEDGEVDYITVVEEVEDNTHILILRVPLSDTEYQDVASVEVEQNGKDDVSMQVVGDEEIYGEEYIVEPDPEPSSSSTTVHVHVHTYPVHPDIFRSPLFSLALSLALAAVSRLVAATSPQLPGQPTEAG